MTKTHLVIPCRAGSKRLPGKHNKRLTDDHSLLEWAVLTALQVKHRGLVDNVVLTTDDKRLNEFVYRAFNGVQCAGRPEYLARDKTPTVKVLDWLAAEAGWPAGDILLLWQPTSPFRRYDFVERLLQRLGTHVLLNHVYQSHKDDGGYTGSRPTGNLYGYRLHKHYGVCQTPRDSMCYSHIFETIDIDYAFHLAGASHVATNQRDELQAWDFILP